MKNRKGLLPLATLLLGLSLGAQADIEDDPQQIARIYSDLVALNEQGYTLHQTYNFQNLDELKACAQDFGHLRAQAKGLQQEIKDLKDPINRLPLAYPADLGFQCVYCGGEIKSCEQQKARLDKVKKSLKL